jgi:NADPH-dependent dioxygenase
MPDTLDVLVVGAGPVGLAAAIELRRRALSVRVIDAKLGPATTSRALGTHARTLEVYRAMGVLDAILDHARPLAAFTVHERGRRITRFGYDFGALGPLKPFSAFIGQADTERILRARLEALGVHVEWDVEMTSLEQDAREVRARLRDGATICARWLIAADGGRSTARKLLGLPFEGAADETWIVADATLETALPPNSIHMFRHPAGNLLIFPFPEAGQWRVLETNPPAAGEERDEARLMARFRERMEAAAGCAVAPRRLGWVSRFTIQQRQVPRLRHGRIFLAGDAAHVHSPASGQGMNTGIQDAFNLAWKLALVHRGAAADSLLDSYDSERRPVSANLLRSAKIATRLIQSRRGPTYALFGAMVRLQDRIPRLHARIERRLTAQLSALPIRYAEVAGLAESGRRFPAITDEARDAPSIIALLD